MSHLKSDVVATDQTGNVAAARQTFQNISQPTELENVRTSPHKHPVVSGLQM